MLACKVRSTMCRSPVHRLFSARRILHEGAKPVSKPYYQESITDFGPSYPDTFVDVSSPVFDLRSCDDATSRSFGIQVQSPNELQARHPGVSKTIPTVPLKRSTKDAYNFSVTDPDDEWTTLPARKKHKSEYLSAFLLVMLPLLII